MEDITKIVENCGLNTTLHYTEACYQNLLRQRFERKGIHVLTEVLVPYVTQDGITFGWGRIDLLCETETEHIIIELKANVYGEKTRQRAVNQLKRYMKHFNSRKKKRGLLVMYNTNRTACFHFEVSMDEI